MGGKGHRIRRAIENASLGVKDAGAEGACGDVFSRSDRAAAPECLSESVCKRGTAISMRVLVGNVEAARTGWL
jgi:hypothetical protein